MTASDRVKWLKWWMPGKWLIIILTIILVVTAIISMYVDAILVRSTELIIAVLTGIAAPIAALQLLQVKRGRDVSFMLSFDRILREGSDRRRRIFQKVPLPKDQSDDYWRRKTQWDHDIETELKNFDRMGLFLWKSHMDKGIFLDIWFDVIARLTFLLHKYVQFKIKDRGEGYLVNFRYLAKENLRYIARNYRSDPIKIERGTKEIPIEFEQLENAVSHLPQRRSLTDRILRRKARKARP